MAFENVDRLALERARNLGFPMFRLDPLGADDYVAKFEIGPDTSAELDEKAVAAALDAASRVFNSSRTTIWLSITTDIIPTAVVAGIERCQAIGFGLVVTHKDKCSHLPGQQLPDRLQLAVEHAISRGQIWHPFAEKLVHVEAASGRRLPR